MIQRIKDYRATWNYTVVEPISGNYVPIATSAFVRDDKKQFTVLNDRGQGGCSLNDGMLEVMIHRRTLGDDDEGVDEPLNETQSITPYPNPQRIGVGLGITGTHKVQFAAPTEAASYWRPSQDRIFAEPYISFTTVPIGTTSLMDWIKNHVPKRSFGNVDLPPNIQLMTLQPWRNNTVLLRLSHQFAVGEDSSLSKVTSIDLTTLFANRAIQSAIELSLTANQNKSQMEPKPIYQIRKEDQQLLKEASSRAQRGEMTKSVSENGKLKAINVSLGPMEIKTFQITFQS